jgi:DNA-binding response OmpR family regulator
MASAAAADCFIDAAAPRIVIVDDADADRGALKRLVARRGFVVIETDSGLAALELIARDPPDLVLLDIRRPHLSGLETLFQLRRRYDAGALPVIMVTAEHESMAAAEFLAAGANDFVTKPVQWMVLQARIDTHLELHHAHMQLVRTRERLEAACLARFQANAGGDCVDWSLLQRLQRAKSADCSD